MWPSTPATLQYSLIIAPSCRSLKRDTTARIRASSRAFAATNERSTTTRLTTWTAASPPRYLHDRGSAFIESIEVADVPRGQAVLFGMPPHRTFSSKPLRLRQEVGGFESTAAHHRFQSFR